MWEEVNRKTTSALTPRSIQHHKKTVWGKPHIICRGVFQEKKPNRRFMRCENETVLPKRELVLRKVWAGVHAEGNRN